jgi:GxxExxY protein
MLTTPRDDDARTFAIIGAAMEVHKVLGPGYLEALFCEALRLEFVLRAVPFQAEVPCHVDYKGHRLAGVHHMDFVCFDSVVVEVKARSVVGAPEHAQVLNYLAVTGLEIGLLINFGAARLDYRRFIRSARRPG